MVLKSQKQSALYLNRQIYWNFCVLVFNFGIILTEVYLVMGKEIIKVPKKFFSEGKGKQDKLATLENTIIKITSKFNRYGFSDKTEEAFLKEFKGKNITIEFLNNMKKTGKLELIDKYKIIIEIDGKIYHYYKHAILCYYPSE